MIADYLIRKGITSSTILFLADFCCILILGVAFGLFLAGLQKAFYLEQYTMNIIKYAFAFLALTVCLLAVLRWRSQLKAAWPKEGIEIAVSLILLVGLLLVILLSAFTSKTILTVIGAIVFIGISSAFGFFFYKLDEAIDDEDDFW